MQVDLAADAAFHVFLLIEKEDPLIRILFFMLNYVTRLQQDPKRDE